MNKEVTPFMGVWIEIKKWYTYHFLEVSHPLWVCGLKSIDLALWHHINRVTPFMGVWIEINSILSALMSICVTPFMGVWIEI